MPLKLLFAFTGAGLLFLGILLPIVVFPLTGEENLLSTQPLLGLLVFVLTLTTLIITLLEAYKWNSIPCVGILALLMYHFLVLSEQIIPRTRVSDMTKESGALLPAGWIVLLGGVILIFFSTLVPQKRVVFQDR